MFGCALLGFLITACVPLAGVLEGSHVGHCGSYIMYKHLGLEPIAVCIVLRLTILFLHKPVLLNALDTLYTSSKVGSSITIPVNMQYFTGVLSKC